MKKLMLTVAALALLSAPVMAAERSAPAGASSVSEKSSSEKPKFVGDTRDCLYKAFGSKGINHHKASEADKNKALKKCFGCKPEVKKVSSLY